MSSPDKDNVNRRIVELYDQGLSIRDIMKTVHKAGETIKDVLDIMRPDRERKQSYDRAKVWALHDAGWTPPEIAKEVDVPVSQIRRELAGERPDMEVRETK